MTYAWAADCAGSFHVGIAAMRDLWLRERRPGETADQWVQRTCRDNHYFRRVPSAEGPGSPTSSPDASPAHKFTEAGE